MHFQDDSTVTGKWLFGTTRSNELTKTSQYMYVWRLDLDSNHDPRDTHLEVKLLDTGDIGASHVTGVYPKMAGDVISMVIWIEASKELQFFEFDFTASTTTGSLLHANILDNPFTVFMGTATQIVDGITIRQSYTVGTAGVFEGTSTTENNKGRTGGIFPSINDSNSCMKDNSGDSSSIDVTSFSDAFMKSEESEFTTT